MTPPRNDSTPLHPVAVDIDPITGGPAPRCLDCGATYRIGDGYGDEQLFCSETCADSYRRELGA